MLPTIRVGQTEREIAAELEAALRRRGSEWHPFPTIVASGPRSALPHARTSARPVGRGEWLLLDFGAQVDGYCADLTRTVVVGAARRRAPARHVRPGALRPGPGAGAPPPRDDGARGRRAGPRRDRRARVWRCLRPLAGPRTGARSARGPAAGADVGRPGSGRRGGHGGAGRLFSGLGWRPAGGRPATWARTGRSCSPTGAPSSWSWSSPGDLRICTNAIDECHPPVHSSARGHDAGQSRRLT